MLQIESQAIEIVILFKTLALYHAFIAQGLTSLPIHLFQPTELYVLQFVHWCPAFPFKKKLMTKIIKNALEMTKFALRLRILPKVAN